MFKRLTYTLPLLNTYTLWCASTSVCIQALSYGQNLRNIFKFATITFFTCIWSQTSCIILNDSAHDPKTLSKAIRKRPFLSTNFIIISCTLYASARVLRIPKLVSILISFAVIHFDGSSPRPLNDLCRKKRDTIIEPDGIVIRSIFCVCVCVCDYVYGCNVFVVRRCTWVVPFLCGAKRRESANRILCFRHMRSLGVKDLKASICCRARCHVCFRRINLQ